MAKAAAVLTMCTVMLGLYFVSTVVLREPATATRLVVDGLTFVMAVVAGQLVSCALLGRISDPIGGVSLGAGLFALPAVVLAVLTFKPPRFSLFQDQIDGSYGIVAQPQR